MWVEIVALAYAVHLLQVLLELVTSLWLTTALNIFIIPIRTKKSIGTFECLGGEGEGEKSWTALGGERRNQFGSHQFGGVV